MDCVFYNILGVLLKFNVCINYGVKLFFFFGSVQESSGDLQEYCKCKFVCLNVFKEGFLILIFDVEAYSYGVYVKNGLPAVLAWLPTEDKQG